MIPHRWLIIPGLAILIVMLVTASFAMGVYVSEHGWTREGLRYQPGEPQPPGGQPALLNQGTPPGNQGLPEGKTPAGLPPGRPQIIGRIKNLTTKSLILVTLDSPRHVILTPQSRFLGDEGEPLSFKDLHPGDVVGIFGYFIRGDGGQFHADIVVRLPIQPQK